MHPSNHTQLIDKNWLAHAFYRQQLKASPDAVNYLKSRGVNGEVAARFGIGWAPAGWQPLSAAFPDYRDDACLVEAGLVVQREGNKRYDRFRERVMFPITTVEGHILGFGGRVFRDDSPKYLNTESTPIFSKGEQLFGLHQAQRQISATGQVVVVEGYMDVVALSQFGRGNAVATLGTALTSSNAARLLHCSPQVAFCFDGDAAGQKAANRALETLLHVIDDLHRVRFITLPGEHDPDSFVREHGAEGWDDACLQGVDLLTFLERSVHTRYAGDWAEQRTARGLAVIKLALGATDDFVLGDVLNCAAKVCGLSRESVDARYYELRRSASKARATVAA